MKLASVMGANLSNPFDEASRERVQEVITEVLETFTVEFLKHYKACHAQLAPPPRQRRTPYACMCVLLPRPCTAPGDEEREGRAPGREGSGRRAVGR